MSIQWTPDLAVGVAEIDAQHKQLFSIVDNLVEAMRLGKGRNETGKVLLFLQNYVVEHFGVEERRMRESNYPGLNGHKAEHDGFIQEFLALKTVHDTKGPSATLSIEINSRVCSWLRNHIARTDKALGAFLNSAKTAAAR